MATDVLMSFNKKAGPSMMSIFNFFRMHTLLVGKIANMPSNVCIEEN